MKIFEAIMQHLDMLNGLTDATKALFVQATKGDAQAVDQILDNRDRLINIISKFQANIEDDIRKLDIKQITKEHIDIFKTWSAEVNQIIYHTDRLDRETTQMLIDQKDQTTAEIANVFKNRQSFRGYDLGNVKK